MLGHAQPGHDDGQPPPRQRRDGHAVLHRAELRRRRQDPHVVQLVQQELLGLAADGVVGREQGEAVRELAEGLDWGALCFCQLFVVFHAISFPFPGLTLYRYVGR